MYENARPLAASDERAPVSWDVGSLVACERASPPSSDDPPPPRYPHLVVDSTWSDEEIAAVVAIDRRAWLSRVEAMRLAEDTEREEEQRARRAKPLRRGLSPIEGDRIMREAKRWTRFGNGRARGGANEAPLLSAAAHVVLGYLVEFVNWLTLERDTTRAALWARTGYKSDRPVTHALSELEALGLFTRLHYHRVHVRLSFSNAEELRALLERAAGRRASASAAPRVAPPPPLAGRSRRFSTPP